MNESHTIQESMKNLYTFEYFSFKKTFSNAFIMLGIGYFLITLLVYLSFNAKVSIFANSFIFIELLIYLVIFLYLGLKITSLRKSSYENGSLFKLKTPLGWLLALIGVFFMLIEDIILQATLITSFIAGYLYVYVLLIIYYLNKRLFFPKENSKALKNYMIGVLLFLIIHFFFWVIVSIFNPSFFGATTIGFIHYTISFTYLRVNSLVTAIILFGIGLLIGREAKSLGRVIHEE